jgi:hypothetical protein
MSFEGTLEVSPDCISTLLYFDDVLFLLMLLQDILQYLSKD